MKKENQILADSPSFLKAYFLAARPKTWIAGGSPVVIGSSLALREGSFSSTTFLLTLLFSLSIQIGTNFANDYFDFIKGADSQERIGPKRATQQGWIAPSQMLKSALFVFAAALIFAFPLMISAGLWSFFLAAICILSGIFYTGGPKPLGYLGLGELFVFIFFGPIAVCGTYFLQTHQINLPSFLASLSPAFLSTAILIANNLRDEETDRKTNKKTLIVRFGKRFGNYEYTAMILGAVAISALFSLLLASLILLIALPLIKQTFQSKQAHELVSLLPKTSFLLLIYTILFYILENKSINSFSW